MKTLKVKDREIPLRIYSKHIKGVQDLLPEGIPFAQATIEAMGDPVNITVPFLWGILQDRNSDEPVPVDNAYELYDDLIDTGKTATDFAQLVLDICTESGFFDKGGREVMAAYIVRIKEVQQKAMQELQAKAKATQTPAPKPRPGAKR